MRNFEIMHKRISENSVLAAEESREPKSCVMRYYFEPASEMKW